MKMIDEELDQIDKIADRHTKVIREEDCPELYAAICRGDVKEVQQLLHVGGSNVNNIRTGDL